MPGDFLPRAARGLALVVLAAGAAPAAEPAGAVVGRGTADGRVLLGELNCVACHAAEKSVFPPRQAAILTEVGARVTPQHLRDYLTAPHAAKPGTVMPDLLHALPPAEKDAAADALAQYLATLGGPFPDKPAGVTAARVERGQVLYHSVGCVACHQPFAAPPKIKRDGPPKEEGDDPPKPAQIETPSVPLGDLAKKTAVEPLAKFLQDPLHVRPSGRMPSLNLTAAEARDVAAYLLRDQRDPTRSVSLPGVEVDTFAGAFTKLPDLAKLTPTRTTEAATAAFPLPKGDKPSAGPVLRVRGRVKVEKGNYRFGIQTDGPAVLTVAGKVVADTAGAKKFKDAAVELAAGEHPFEAVFLHTSSFAVQWQPPTAKNLGNVPANVLSFPADAAAPKAAAFTPDKTKAAMGKELFASLGCASCHQVGKDPLTPLKAPELTKLVAAKPDGCLSETPGKGRPRYDLTAAQRTALSAALADPKPADPKAVIAHTTTALNCVACHARGDSNPDAGRAAYFVYEAVADLGDEGRLPPSLTGVGSKLTPAGFQAAMFAPAGTPKYRPYMATRMPNFGPANAGHLPELFAKADAGFVASHTPAFNLAMLSDGRHLSGKNALACVNCHSWGGYRVQGAEGLDLLDTVGRLQPAWFHAWLLDPNKIRRGTRMPTGWPEGKSPYPTIQGGDTHKQIDAIWTHLQAGARGGLPAGLVEPEARFLVPTDRPIVFRTFLDRVGAHAILVGFPERTHLAFDANRVRTAALWGGPFVSTKEAWDGRAGLYAPVPSPDAIRLPDGPPFAALKSASDPWPADVPRPKLGSARTPPGWKYLGYRLDDKDVPTFLYRVNDVEVEETPAVVSRKDGVFLARRFVLTSPADVPDFYYRATAGKITAADGTFVVDGKQRWRLTGAAVRPGAGGAQELVLPVKFARAGDGWTASFDVEVSW
ncbi:MAG: hypothetical protein C0501_23615 [Isosphaera sp.]|nr:hypothetical protein [Isosphaera sp.]